MLAALVAGLWACACALIAVPSKAAATPRSCPGADLRPNGHNQAAIDAGLICVIDEVRIAYGLRALRPNSKLQRVAASQVRAMVRMDYFADVRPSGQTPLALIGGSGYPLGGEMIRVGQNLAWGTGVDATPAHVVDEWMASPPHRAIMLTAGYEDAGAGVTAALPSVLGAGSLGGTFAVEFGVRLR